MSVLNLDSLFRPSSIAVIGASNRPQSIGAVIMRNLLAGGFAGPVMPVNPSHDAVAGVWAYQNVAGLPVPPSLAILCTPAPTVPGLIAELGQRGTRAAIVLSAGLAREPQAEGPSQREMLEAARPHALRILGPNTLGLLAPGVGLNASFAHTGALPGRLAFIAQSGGLATAVLDWARSNGIGFSHFVSLGDMADIDFGDILDYLGSDPETSAILLYIESIRDARKFMSAARAAARNKPVLAIKSGRVPEGARAAASHTGALAGADDVYHAAIRRAGMLRVFEVDELFDAVETLGRSRPVKGDRLAILTNGGGPGVIATDALVSGGGRLAELSEETLRRLDAAMPSYWSRGNPVDIAGDAPGERYAEALKALLDDPGVDAVLAMHVPTAIASSEEAAREIVRVAKGASRNVLTSWLGREAVAKARRLFADAGVPTYDTPDKAVRAFLHMVKYRRNQEMLMETPPSAPAEFTPVTSTARLVIQNALAEGRRVLTEPEAKAVLAAYGVPIVETHITPAAAEDAVGVSRRLGFPVALKVLSPDITHKSDVGGVALDLETPEAVAQAAAAMKARLAKLRPDARLTGFTVQRMARRPGAHELIAGASTDPVFGPVILFGQGGKAVEVIGDRAVGLPPLNMSLARDLISRTRVFQLLRGYRDQPAADLDAICLTLLQISQLVIDIAEVVELDINPLFADDEGVLALDARIAVAPAIASGAARLAIRPYPKQLEEWTTLQSGRRVFMRPIRPEDEPAHYAFVSRLTPEDIRFRFFGLVREFPHSQMARFTQIDYNREMAFIAQAPDEHGKPETLGVVRTVMDPDNRNAEFAIVVRSDLKGQGLGHALLEKMIRYCRDRGIREVVGQALSDNVAMLRLAETFGFKSRKLPGENAVEVKLRLR
ncbi:MAG: GNAT family N-acetyltransferase [Candidatus Tectomicrobia bacterium]|nr:GNAT family N-acetyltransferase [Candidatus Tectomicrobia bacterium]